MSVNHKNLKLLRDWLAENDIPFDMCQYRSHGEGCEGYVADLCREDLNEYIEVGRIPPECGSHGCVLGWAPFVPGLEAEPSDFDGHTLNFQTYCRRVTGIDQDEGLWDVLFSEVWAYTKYNTKADAIQRLDHVINGPIGGVILNGRDADALVSYWESFNPPEVVLKSDLF